MTSPSRAHSRASLLALSVAIATAFVAGVFGALTAIVGVVVIALGHARERGFALARALERPRLFAVLGALYAFVFLADVFVLGRENPVPALGRLVVFLIAAEVLAGDRSRGHRPILFGMLLMVAAAAQTTDLWFALPLAAFTWAAVASQMRSTLASPASPIPPPSLPRAAAIRVTAASLVVAALFFALIPRVGAGWGRTAFARPGTSDLETGLAPSVRLGVLGKVKARRTIAFRARVTAGRDDLEAVYWRARSYDVWTGNGWMQRDTSRDEILPLPAGELVAVPPEYASRPPELTVQVSAGGAQLPALPVPGRGLWVRSPREAAIIASADGSLAPGGASLRTYEVGSLLTQGAPGPAGSTDPQTVVVDTHRDVRDLDPAIAGWARGIAPQSATPSEVAQSFVDDLSTRAYSLDTRRVDPARPVASFLAGAPAHCEYFATAMALGLRARGIPSRVVGGYLGAQREPFGKEWIVRDSRAHLWTEAFLPDVGWVPFDPTPAAGRVPPVLDSLPWMVSAAEYFVLLWDTWVIGFDLGDQVDVLLTLEHWLRALARLASSVGPWIALAVLLAATALVVSAFRRFSPRRPGRDGDGVPSFYHSLLTLAHGRGLEIRPSETASRFAARAGPVLGDVDAVAFVSHLYERERFAGRPPSTGELHAAQAALKRLAAARS